MHGIVSLLDDVLSLGMHVLKTTAPDVLLIGSHFVSDKDNMTIHV